MAEAGILLQYSTPLTAVFRNKPKRQHVHYTVPVFSLFWCLRPGFTNLPQYSEKSLDSGFSPLTLPLLIEHSSP